MMGGLASGVGVFFIPWINRLDTSKEMTKTIKTEPALTADMLLDAFRGVMRPLAEPAPHGRRASAVLIPLVEDKGELKVILTKRSSQLRHHAGQISFPGGAIDDGETVQEAAFREAHEEINLHPSHVDMMGFLPGVLTTANFHIAPVLALVKRDLTAADINLSPHPDEVDRILLEPIHPLLKHQHHRQEPRQYNGVDYQTWVIDHHEEYIWGATAKLIVQWSRLLPMGLLGRREDLSKEGAA